MAASWLIWVLAGAILVSMVLLGVLCLHCRTNGPLVSIRQMDASEDYMPSTGFIVLHPSQTNTNFLSPCSPSAHPGSQSRVPSIAPTETESNPSYENPADDPEYINAESDAEDPGYIIVLPDGETPLTNQSRASTPSSGVLHDYENVPEKREDRDYLNVDPLHFQPGSTLDLSAQSNSSSDDDEDDEGNYVNVHDGSLAD
ncbi:linker for activation of T-cells family member 1 [Etheostoma spectabile]|uniref:linker for activation of T-cells family member 1 n=1 Tax=Etheostoma spectabile TaxID=54343 RepID=UPI0013AFA9E1|nr:linker for activation of T-cells family member 1 [Etheostoma spectabile]